MRRYAVETPPPLPKNSLRDASIVDPYFPTTFTGSPPQAFPDVGQLLCGPEFWRDWLDHNPSEAELLSRALLCLGRLERHTRWDLDPLLEHLGCPAKSVRERLELGRDRLLHCLSYFEWVESLLCWLDLHSDKRLTVSGAARLFANADKDLEACRSRMDSGDFPPLEYLKLGEVAQSWQAAILTLPTQRGERARRTAEANPFVEPQSPHISPRRLDLLNAKDARALLGEQVEARAWTHLKHCPSCRAAYERRRSTADRVSAALSPELLAAHH